MLRYKARARRAKDPEKDKSPTTSRMSKLLPKAPLLPPFRASRAQARSDLETGVAAPEKEQLQLRAEERAALKALLEAEEERRQLTTVHSEHEAEAELEVTTLRAQLDELSRACEAEYSQVAERQLDAMRAAEAMIVDLERARWAENVRASRHNLDQASKARGEWETMEATRTDAVGEIESVIAELESRLRKATRATKRIAKESKKKEKKEEDLIGASTKWKAAKKEAKKATAFTASSKKSRPTTTYFI